MTRLVPPFSLSTAVAVVTAVAWAPAGRAAEPGAARRAFILPAERAGRTLRLFADQAGVEVVFAAETTGRVPTNPVQGSFTPEEALAALLHGTGLVAERNPRTGAFTILRAAAAPRGPPTEAEPTPPPAPPKTTESQPKDSPPVKNRSLFAFLAGLFAATSPEFQAQATPGTPVAREEAYVLSPFTVSSDRDTGYAATNTLAGTRLNTPVADLGASISIYTRDLLSDLGATNGNDLLIYATGMEAAGPGGTISASLGSINATVITSEGQRTNPQGSTRARGLSSPNLSRNYFISEIPIDAYITDAVTVSRGPNALLFGVGSPAGIVDTTLIRPNLRANSNKVEFRYGNNDSARSTVDFNRVLVRDKLALRVAGLIDNERFNQRPAFDENRRLYGAITARPFKTTELRANFETGNSRANRPITVLPYNSISPAWYAAGRPGFDWTYYDDPARNPAAAAQSADQFEGFLQGQAQIFDMLVLAYSKTNGSAPDVAFRGALPSTGGAAANAYRSGVFNATINRDSASDGVRFLGTLNAFELPAGWWTGSRVLPGQQPGFVPANMKMQGFTDYSAFDFKNRMIDETGRQLFSFHTLNVALEQRFWRDRLGVELAYDSQFSDRRSKNSFFSQVQANHIRIDPNMYLPDGRPNPNLGRPYITYGQSNWADNLADRQTLRGTAYARYDFKDLGPVWAAWLGRHSLTGLAERYAVDSITYTWRLASDGELALAVSPDIRVFNRRPAINVYLGPSIIGNNNPLRLEPIRIPELTAGPTTSAYFFRRSGDATDPGAFVETPASLVEVNNGGSAQREVIKSQAFALQSYWLKEHVVTLLGWRRDEDYFARRTIVTGSPLFDAPQRSLNDPGKVYYGLNDLAFPHTPPPNVAKEVKSGSVVMRWPSRLLRLPLQSELSAFINRSENFTPAGGRIDFYGDPLASPQGVTKEYGLNLSVLGGKVSFRLNRFETAVQRQSVGSPAPLTAVNAIVQNATFWATEGNRNPGNVGFMNAAIEKLYSALPPNYRTVYSYSVSGAAPNISANFVTPGGTTDITDVSAKGVEFDIVCNPTRNLRLLLNVAQQETVTSNSFPVTKNLIARLTPIWNGSVTFEGVTVPMRDIPRGGYPVGTGPTNPPSAATERYGSWLDANIFVPFATGLAQEGSASPEQRKWRANLVANYSFGRDSIFGERLKGWSVGTGVRWQDKLGIGYPSTRNPNGSVNLALKNPFYTPAETNVDAWVAYARRVFSNRIDWKVQLNARNLISRDDLIGITVQPWGDPAMVRLPPEKRWYLTNTFSF